ncbi:hypothetical protein ACT7C9_04160 [Bacillus cereus]|uniref:hypothetical protein n=1 Tax=Bacillus cereus group TaxID=86661 RepID=UPI000BF87A63|nr:MULTISPECIES: hypothetical protein [Bacillus cereus group]MBE5089578.1 hypothetical protein [Bacillus thuringiensis]PEZ60905.1 hypothetical protein CN370_11495 [Bacillus cereus]PGS28409.1 hypothetical protein COC59_05285 [Bacillus cereus]
MEYQVPIKPKERFTFVAISNYGITNPVSFNRKNLSEKEESHLIMDLAFLSNDYSPDKFTHFFDEFNKFLDEFNKNNAMR